MLEVQCDSAPGGKLESHNIHCTVILHQAKVVTSEISFNINPLEVPLFSVGVPLTSRRLAFSPGMLMAAYHGNTDKEQVTNTIHRNFAIVTSNFLGLWRNRWLCV